MSTPATKKDSAGTAAKTADTITVALVGSGGSGVMTAGDLLLRAAAKGGWYGMMTRSSGPQIRGGEAAAYVTVSRRPVEGPSDRFDMLYAIDWKNADRFSAEIPLDEASLIVSGEAGADVPEAFTRGGAPVAELDVKALLKDISGGRPNMLGLGAVATLLGIPADVVEAVLEKRLGKKGAMAVESSAAATQLGASCAAGLPDFPSLAPPPADRPESWVITGNQAAGLGALRGGIRLVAAYPITPATEILEWMSPRLPKVGGNLVQAEDELASINMAIGASYGGTPAMTATSGPGLALMTESIGLAIASETPVVVVDVMRGGPSTGIPTKSEQGDLNLAVYGMHGDAPHVVVAPTSIADCVFTTQWAVHLAESMQTAAIVLSDQALGQAVAVIDKPADIAFATRRLVADKVGESYHRYALTGTGVSPMALPGTPGGQYTADGLEHNPRGTPSSMAEDHAAQMEKRLHKIVDFDYGNAWADVDGSGDIAVIVWGSMSGPVREAARRVDPDGGRVRVISMRLLAPARPDHLAAVLDGAERTLVVEQTHSAQFYHYLVSQFGLDAGRAESLHRPGPLPLRPAELETKIREWTEQ